MRRSDVAIIVSEITSAREALREAENALDKAEHVTRVHLAEMLVTEQEREIRDVAAKTLKNLRQALRGATTIVAETAANIEKLG